MEKFSRNVWYEFKSESTEKAMRNDLKDGFCPASDINKLADDLCGGFCVIETRAGYVEKIILRNGEMRSPEYYNDEWEFILDASDLKYFERVSDTSSDRDEKIITHEEKSNKENFDLVDLLRVVSEWKPDCNLPTDPDKMREILIDMIRQRAKMSVENANMHQQELDRWNGERAKLEKFL